MCEELGALYFMMGTQDTIPTQEGLTDMSAREETNLFTRPAKKNHFLNHSYSCVSFASF